MNILILSNAFKSKDSNLRLRYQCNYLEQQGHQIEVYTEPWDPITFEHTYPIHEVGERVTTYWRWLLISIYSFITNYKDRKFAFRVLWHTRKQHFDVVLCSTDSSFPLGAARLVAQSKHIPLHVDLVEIDELAIAPARWYQPWQKLQQTVYIGRRNRALKHASSITTISPEYVQFVENINPNVELMYNGFDPNQFYANNQKTTLFRVNYIGRSYSSQNFDMVLRISDALKAELPKAQWSYYCNEFNYNHFKHARPNICGMMPTEILGDTMRQSSILLLLNDTKDKGVQNEQFYQALGCEKPILFTDTVNGTIPELIRMTNAGLCANNTTDCMEFIRKLYHQWEADGYTRQPVKNKEWFDAKVQAQRLEQMLQQMTQN